MSQVPSIPQVPFQTVNQPNVAVPNTRRAALFAQFGQLLNSAAGAVGAAVESETRQIEQQAYLRSLGRQKELAKYETAFAKKSASAKMLAEETRQLADREAELAQAERDSYFAATWKMSPEEKAAFDNKHRLFDERNRRVQAENLGIQLARQYGDRYMQEVTKRLQDAREMGVNPASVDTFDILENLMNEVATSVLVPVDENDAFAGTAFTVFQDRLMGEVESLKSAQARAYFDERDERSYRATQENARADLLKSFLEGSGADLPKITDTYLSNVEAQLGETMDEQAHFDQMIQWIGEAARDGLFPSSRAAIDYLESIPPEHARLRDALGLTTDASGGPAPTGLYARFLSKRDGEIADQIGAVGADIQKQLNLFKSDVDTPPEFFDMQMARLDEMDSIVRNDDERAIVELRKGLLRDSIMLAKANHEREFGSLQSVRRKVESGNGHLLEPDEQPAFTKWFEKDGENLSALPSLISSMAANRVPADFIPTSFIQERVSSSLKRGVTPSTLAQAVDTYRSMSNYYGQDMLIRMVDEAGVESPLLMPAYVLSLKYNDMAASDGRMQPWHENDEYIGELNMLVQNVHLIPGAKEQYGLMALKSVYGRDGESMREVPGAIEASAQILAAQQLGSRNIIGQQQAASGWLVDKLGLGTKYGAGNVSPILARMYEAEFVSEYVRAVGTMGVLNPDMAKDEDFTEQVAEGAANAATAKMLGRTAVINYSGTASAVDARSLGLPPENDPASNSPRSSKVILEQLLRNVSSQSGSLGNPSIPDLTQAQILNVPVTLFGGHNVGTFRIAYIPFVDYADGVASVRFQPWPTTEEGQQHMADNPDLYRMIESEDALFNTVMRGLSKQMVRKRTTLPPMPEKEKPKSFIEGPGFSSF